MSTAVWPLIALPLAGAVVLLLGGRRTNAWGHLLGCATVLASFCWGALLFVDLLGREPGQRVDAERLFSWVPVAGLQVDFGLHLDPLSVCFVLLITGVGFLIHVYSVGYMAEDVGRRRFFAYLNLFVAAMLTLVLGDSLPLLFVGWEGVGMCSYLLIGFWYTDPAKAYAGRKAFITNRIGDFGFLVGSFIMVLALEAAMKMPADVSSKLGRPGLEGTSVLARLSDGAKQKGPLSVSVLEEGSKVFASLLDDKIPSGPLEGLTQAVSRTWEMSALTLRMLGKMLIGQASLKNLSGPLTIADVAGQTVRLGLAYYLGFLAIVSIGLGVLNLLPLPVLDGGHLMYYLFEGLTGRPVSDLWLARLQRGGIAVLLAMMSVALFNDVARLLGQH